MNAARLTLWCKGLLALAVVLLLGWITSASVHAQAENPSPVPLAPAAQLSATGLLTDIRAVAVGGAHSCALTSSGGVKCWGDNSYGQLGDGSQADHLTPVVVTGLTAGVQSVSAGNTYTCAVTSSGGVKCWGYNFDGQLGDGTTTDRLTPVDVNGLTGGVQAVVAGSDHTCALTIDGGIKCWGDNSYGQLGDGTWTDRLAPVDVSGLTGGVQAVTIGQKHTCALTTAGGVQCWGRNYYGELGDGTHIYSRTPVDVSGLTSGVQAIAAGQKHTCALTTAGGVQCWGNNEFGQLGDGTTFERLEPEEVSGLTSGVQAITAGAIHTCALTTAGGVKCWGDNGAGQLGDGTHSSRKTPIDVMTLTEGIQVLAAGSGHTCALTTAGGVKCWGDNRQGQLGDGRTDRLTPVDITGLSEGVQILAAGGGHTCALTAAGGVQCWGLNSSGQLGDGTANSRTTPADVSGLTSGVQAITAGGSHTCALTNTGGVKCWGYNFNGQLGDGTTTDRWTPVDVIGLTDGVQAIAADTLHTCALTVGGGVKCWDGTYAANWVTARQLTAQRRPT